MNGSKYTVFLVDDEMLIRNGLKMLFNWNEHGFRICGDAPNGKDALPLIIKEKADVVITDLKMPFLGGIELAQLIAEKQPSTRVIVLTGYGELSLAQQAIRANVFDFLLKPVDPDELEKVMDRLYTVLENREFSYPFEEEEKILTAITCGDAKPALDALGKIKDNIGDTPISDSRKLQIYTKLLKSIKATHEASSATRNQVIAPVLTGEVSSTEAYLLLEKYLINIFADGSAHSPNVIVEKIKHYLKENYSSDITLPMLSETFFLNPSYISRIFKQHEGENYRSYLFNIRIEHAKKLLVTTDRSILQISEIVGFGNSKYFSRLFKKITGLNPMEYRHENRK